MEVDIDKSFKRAMHPWDGIKGEAGGMEAGAARGAGHQRLLASGAHGALRPVHICVVCIDGGAELLSSTHIGCIEVLTTDRHVSASKLLNGAVGTTRVLSCRNGLLSFKPLHVLVRPLLRAGVL